MDDEPSQSKSKEAVGYWRRTPFAIRCSPFAKQDAVSYWLLAMKGTQESFMVGR